jgi:hypothetical protein
LLILFLEPKILAEAFFTPANSKITLTTPPAFNPLPFLAGFKRTLADLNFDFISKGIVSSTIGTSIMFFFAALNAFSKAKATSFPFATP